MTLSSLVDALLGFAFGAGGATALSWLLRRREVAADIVAKQQEVIDSLWRRIDELQKRIDELEREVGRIEEEAQQLRRLLRAYESRYGRRFRIAPGGRIVELSEGAANNE
jgi:cell division protein FtsB